MTSNGRETDTYNVGMRTKEHIMQMLHDEMSVRETARVHGVSH